MIEDSKRRMAYRTILLGKIVEAVLLADAV